MLHDTNRADFSEAHTNVLHETVIRQLPTTKVVGLRVGGPPHRGNLIVGVPRPQSTEGFPACFGVVSPRRKGRLTDGPFHKRTHAWPFTGQPQRFVCPHGSAR